MILESSYTPAWWLPGPHLMTVFAALARRTRPPPTKRERLELPDGDFLDLDWGETTRDSNAPLILVLHGLEGSIESPYASGMMDALAQAGFAPALLHFRGCSGEPNRLARAYHSGETEDLRWVLARCRERFPRRAIGAVGFSLGGNVLLKYLGEEGARTPIAAAVAVSAPMRLAPCAQRLETGFSRVYDRRLLETLKHKVADKQKRGIVKLAVGPEELRRLRSLREFDEHVTAPLHGFAGAEDYYARSSSAPHLSRISVPTLIVHAADDPFMTPAVIPSSAELGSSVTLELSARGGHVGFVSGPPRAPRYWLDERVPAYFSGQLGASAERGSRP